MATMMPPPAASAPKMSSTRATASGRQRVTVHGYTTREQLGAGGNATVYRAKANDGQLAAIKVIAFEHADSKQAEHKWKLVVREVKIHETLKHANLLEFIAGEPRERHGVWPKGMYLVMQLGQLPQHARGVRQPLIPPNVHFSAADGGDLFDKITPDVGIDEDIAHLYFTQLVSALKYLGKHGICHRDIKPENCLLTGNGNLLVSDFGLATVFKMKGQTRLLKDRCGSPPYAAPELAHSAPYAAEPIDVWSAGVLLFTLLVGNTPWDEPTRNSPEFAAFLDRSLLKTEPWNKINKGLLRFLLRLLEVDAGQRATIHDIEREDWFRQHNPLVGEDGQCTDGHDIFRRMARSLQQYGLLGAPTEVFQDVMSHPTPQQAMSQRGLDPNASFVSSLRLYSKLSMAPTQRTNPNLTRFFTAKPMHAFLHDLTATLTNLNVPHQTITTPAAAFLARVRITTLDSRGQDLLGSITISESILPDHPEDLSQAVQEMDVDEDDDSTTRSGQGTKGFDIVMWRKSADPLELKRLWIKIVKNLPSDCVFAT
ncbi:Chk1 protein kinase [Microbotryomycetes sp. JL201]|nr:Chk1 protein kinase [Microbotryomycetes sp. JL201]